MSDAHVDAVKALVGNAVRLYEGAAPTDAVLPYAVLHMASPTAARTSLAATSDRRNASWTVTSVGQDPAGARSVAARVRAAVLDRRPAVAGRSSSTVTQTVGEPLRVDRDVTPHRPYLVDGYSFFTVPAPSA